MTYWPLLVLAGLTAVACIVAIAMNLYVNLFIRRRDRE
jgi:hypothetical protein